MGAGGVGMRVDGQPVVEVIADTPEVRDALDLASQPAGLVELVPWLEPVSG